MSWVVLRRRAVARAKVDGSGETKFVFEREPGMPEYGTRSDAIRAITVLMCGVQSDATEEVIRTHWSRYRSNVGHHRVEKQAS